MAESPALKIRQILWELSVGEIGFTDAEEALQALDPRFPASRLTATLIDVKVGDLEYDAAIAVLEEMVPGATKFEPRAAPEQVGDRCPDCGHEKSRVIDIRRTELKLRRRRECLACGHRWSTKEIIDTRSKS